MVRLRDALRPLRVPADVLVTSRSVFEEWRDTPNNVLFEAWTEGRRFMKWDEQADDCGKAAGDEAAIGDRQRIGTFHRVIARFRAFLEDCLHSPWSVASPAAWLSEHRSLS